MSIEDAVEQIMAILSEMKVSDQADVLRTVREKIIAGDAVDVPIILAPGVEQEIFRLRKKRTNLYFDYLRFISEGMASTKDREKYKQLGFKILGVNKRLFNLTRNPIYR
jgi:hypothetical protein